MAIVTVAELKKYMSGINLNATQEAAAESVIAGVQAELELHINRSVEKVAVREYVCADETGFLYLSQTPVWEVRSVTVANVDPSTQTPDAPIILGPMSNFDGPEYDRVPSGFRVRPGGVQAGAPGGWYVVEYVGGGGAFIAPHLPAIKLAVMRVAAREIQTMHDDTMSLRETSTTEPTDPVPLPAKGWTEAELKRFDRIRRRVVM